MSALFSSERNSLNIFFNLFIFPIIFIINGDLNTTDAGAHDISISALKKFLVKHHLEGLYDGKINSSEDDEFEKLLNSEAPEIKDQNIIKANLKSIKDNRNNIIPISYHITCKF